MRIKTEHDRITLVLAFKAALGRETGGSVHAVVAEILENWDILPPECRALIKREIERAYTNRGLVSGMRVMSSEWDKIRRKP